MRIMHFCGGRTCAGANSAIAEVICSMMYSIGRLSSRSNSGLRGSNHSRRLLRSNERRNFRAAGVNHAFVPSSGFPWDMGAVLDVAGAAFTRPFFAVDLSL